jgi:hypothetical protein
MIIIIKPIIGYPKYLISNDGRVFSLDYNHTKQTKILKPQNSHGYKRIALCKNGTSKLTLIHRLVLIHFLRQPILDEIANHKDGNKKNNYIENLEWVTPLENIRHAQKNGLIPSASKKKRVVARKLAHKLGLKNRRLTMKQAKEIRKMYSTGKYFQRELASLFGIGRQCIGDIINNHAYKEV